MHEAVGAAESSVFKSTTGHAMPKCKWKIIGTYVTV